MYVVAQTWVIVKYDIKKVLVTPGDVELILLEERHQDFLPLQCYCCHVILEGKIQRSRGILYHFTSGNQKPAILENEYLCQHFNSKKLCCLPMLCAHCDG